MKSQNEIIIKNWLEFYKRFKTDFTALNRLFYNLESFNYSFK
ncbi:hypothetical protein SAMN05661096_02465 [Marivirga sericea]|uniref:Uncharacterized protein n=1 Tax=Marivirga sericea TaxID=1028 RepID=A0A1X7K9C8_9BACT|nr:hypothetical protein SAMN05661096_02465 [Marivirga sericea]